MADLSRKRERERLPARREPHWQRLSEGAYLGFRRGPDTWLVRFRGRDRKQQYKSLGEGMEFDEAKRLAEAWVAQIGGPATRSVKRGTVREALEAYLEDLRRHRRAEAASEALWRYKATVYEDRIAECVLESATQEDFLEWRDRLIPGRQPRTVNRYVRAVVAGLNKARTLGHVGNPAAWEVTPLADDVEDEGEPAVLLSASRRAAIIAAATPQTADFLRGLDLTGARPKELAAAKLSDFDGQTLKLAHRKGRPPRLRVRHVVLSAEAIEFFTRMARDKLPGAVLFTEDGEQPWRRHVWAREIRAAIVAHNQQTNGKDRIPAGVSAYSFRHARISELLQIHGVDPLTVAMQCGTSLVMIERNYSRFIPSAIQAKLAAVKASA